jgi:hypothetical protein
MKPINVLIILLFSYVFNINMLAQENLNTAKNCFYETKQELTDMLNGYKPLNYEQAIIAVENAYWENQLNTALFSELIDLHVGNIQKLIDVNRNYSKQNFKATFLQTEEQKRENYETALTNWAIYTYMTDTTYFVEQDKLWYNLPLDYSIQDPMGTADWHNTQVANLLFSRQGNCYAQTALFKIFSERLQSQVTICTAPGHIYIRHANEKGIFFNVEPATHTFPGTGSIETLTYTSDEATRNGISLRELDLKQSVALCLVYLAKGYEYKFHTKSDDFLLECAQTTLQHDSLNLNAMLLKAEVLEERIVQKNKSITELQTDKDFAAYEKWITHIHKLGYREMPLEMKNALIAGLQKENFPYIVKDKTPQPYKHLGVKDDRYATLSRGLFEELDYDKPIEQYGRTLFDSKKKKIISFSEIPQLYNQYNFDPVVFAWQIDPLAHEFPMWSPYVAFNDDPIRYADPDGRSAWDKIVGSGIGFLTNIVPGSSGVRDWYEPDDASDYNNALQAADVATMAFSENMTKHGGTAVAVGGAVAAGGLAVSAGSGGALAIGGVPVATAGGALVAAGAATSGVGVLLMANTAGNASGGYDRGNKSSSGNTNNSSKGGTQVNSKTLWKDSNGKGRIDVENPAPNKRPGQIHYQNEKGEKYIYNSTNKKFMEKDSKTGKYTINAPNSVNDLLQNKDIKQAIDKGLKYLGE